MKKSTRWIVAMSASVALTMSAPVATATGADSARGGGSVSRSAATDHSARIDLGSSPAREALDRVINPDDYECGPTDFDVYIDQLLSAMTADDFGFLLNNLEMLDIATFDALLFGTSSDARYALRPDSAHRLRATFRDARRFWDIQSADIQLMAMHGSTLQDTARSARVLRLVFGYSPAEAATRAQRIAQAVATRPAFAGGDNPLFTLNAFAFTAEGDPDPLVAGVPDKIIFGDGILDALEFMGIENVGSRAVLSHEFAHHVQIEKDLFDSPLTGAEATRRTELMADAFGTYFATHARGLSLNTKRVLQAERTFFVVGDCAFDDPGHHGTPNQRFRAAAWAADLADSARPQGRILPSLRLADLFEDELPDLVAPDAS